MARPGHVGTGLSARLAPNLLIVVGLAGFALWAVVSTGQDLLSVGGAALHALWLLPVLTALHLVQLLLSSEAWSRLIPARLPLRRVYRMRLIREGIDSLLPVAQVGGELVGAQLLSRHGPTVAQATASVVVDVTVEFLTQLAFLLAGVAALAASARTGWHGWLGAAALTGSLAAGLLAAQRFGLFQLLEALARRIAARWPAARALVGLNEAAAAIYRRRSALVACTALHFVSWLLGSLESWAVLHGLGYPVSPLQAVIVEALGMAARSAGFAIPGALVVQETGFALAAAAIGLPKASGLSLSLVKRAREVIVGLLGLALWWAERNRPP